jgi:hypothetical protein
MVRLIDAEEMDESILKTAISKALNTLQMTGYSPHSRRMSHSTNDDAGQSALGTYGQCFAFTSDQDVPLQLIPAHPFQLYWA